MILKIIHSEGLNITTIFIKGTLPSLCAQEHIEATPHLAYRSQVHKVISCRKWENEPKEQNGGWEICSRKAELCQKGISVSKTRHPIKLRYKEVTLLQMVVLI